MGTAGVTNTWMVIVAFPLFERCGEEPAVLRVWRRQVEEAGFEETSEQSLVHLPNRQRLYFGETELLHILATVLMWPLPFLHWWLCKVLKREVMEDERLRSVTVSEGLIRLFKWQKDVFGRFCLLPNSRQISYAYSLLGNALCLLNTQFWYYLWRNAVMTHFFKVTLKF